jgi:hypothetical protein
MYSITIGNEIQTFVNIYYVDAVAGVDTNPGTEGFPLKTVQAAVTKCASTGDAVVAREGVYDVTTTGGSYGYGGLSDAGKSIFFIGGPGKTVFKCDGVKNTGRDHHAICTYGETTTIYGIIFDVSFGNRTSSYGVGLFGRDSLNTNAYVYNCWFKVSGLGTGLAIVYDGYNTNNIFMYNCLIETTRAIQQSYGGGTRPTLVNVACTNQLYMNEGKLITCVSNITVGAEGRITSSESVWKDKGTGTDIDGSVADIGVYGGLYSWEVTGMVITFSEPEIIVPKNTDVQFPYRITPPLPAAASKQLPMTRTVAGAGHRHRSEDIELAKWHDIIGVVVT